MNSKAFSLFCNTRNYEKVLQRPKWTSSRCFTYLTLQDNRLQPINIFFCILTVFPLFSLDSLCPVWRKTGLKKKKKKRQQHFLLTGVARDTGHFEKALTVPETDKCGGMWRNEEAEGTNSWQLSWYKNTRSWAGVAAQAFNPSTVGAETGISLKSLRPAWSRVLGHPGLYSETLLHKNKKPIRSESWCVGADLLSHH